MSSVRAFIALHIPPETQQQCGMFIRHFQRVIPPGIRWEAVNKIHLTFRFLGDVSTREIDQIKSILDQLPHTTEPFPVVIGGLGVFPHWRAPRVIWLAMDRTAPLLTLQHSIDQAVNQLGFLPEKRPFAPHLTLGRVQNSVSPVEASQIGDVLKSQPDVNIGSISCDTVTLFQSILKPSGSVYVPIHTTKLIKKV